MKKNTEAEFAYKFGRMIKGQSSLMLSDDQLSDTLNLTPGYGWKQRKGMTALTASAVATGLRFKSAIQFRTLDGSTDCLLAHTYDSTNGERIMRGSALPPSSITWSEMYDLTAGCEIAQWANVANAIVVATGEDFIIWFGDGAKPTGVFFYDDTTGKYTNYYDEVTDGDAATAMPLNSMQSADAIYVIGPAPLSEVDVDVGEVNTTDSDSRWYYWNGAWTRISRGQVANGDIYEADMSSLTGWTNVDSGTGASTQVTFRGEDAYKLTNGATSGSTDFARIYRDVGTFGTGTIYVTFDFMQEHPNGNEQGIYRLDNGTTEFLLYLYATNVVIYNSTGSTSISSLWNDLEQVRLTLKLNWSTELCDVWVNGVLKETDVSFDRTSINPDGYLMLDQHGNTHADNVVWFTKVSVGSALTGSATGNFNDETAVTGVTLAQDGSLTWDTPTDEIPTTIQGIPGYAYKWVVGGGCDSATDIEEITVKAPMVSMPNLWDGGKTFVTGCYVYDGTKYKDYTAYVNNDVEAQGADLSGATTSYRLFVGSPYRLSGIEFNPSSTEPNTANAQIDKVYYFNDTGAETEPGSFTDNTLANTASFNQKGTVTWETPAYGDEKPTTVAGDTSPMYWYIFEWDATLSDPTSIYRIEGIPVPDDVKPSLGTFGFKRRVWQIAPKGEENAVRFSAANLPTVWNGLDSGYIYFGERPLVAAVSLYNEAMVFADTEIWMIKGSTPSNFGRLRLSGTIGCSAVDSIVTVESGILVDERIKNVVAWFFADGIWVFDNSRIWKISAPDIDSFFDPLHEDYINPAYLDQTYGTYDHESQTAQWIVYSGASATTPTKVIVMHFPSMWYGIYEYGTEISCILPVINDRYYTVGGAFDTGKFFRLYDGITDLDDSGNTVAVDAYAVTRDMFISVSDGMRQRLLSVWAESAAAGGMIELDEYPDGSVTPQNIGKRSMTWLGKLFGVFQRNLKVFSGQKTTKFRVRNRSKNARMVLIGHSTTADRGRAEE